ncbi:MAG: anhydro-N-acetylmuramic acid kinase [Gemmatimonadota bacterium]
MSERTTSDLYVGLMSGTSLDGIDVAVVQLGGRGERPDPARLVTFRSEPYDAPFRRELRALAEGRRDDAASLCEFGFALGDRFADAVLATLAGAGLSPPDVTAIGSHGQTVRHLPPVPGGRGSTLQIGEAAVIAERTGIPVVADFRVRDMAAGGHGAPLTPAFDRLLLSSRDEARGILNLGGMANLTALPRPGGGQPVAFDTGPGVALIDAAVERLTAGERDHDVDGRIAAEGEIREEALADWLDDPFFATPPPRSTGRERFGKEAAERWLADRRDLRPEDLVATLTELTARTVADSLCWVAFPLDGLFLCGGGARNPELRRRIAGHLDPRPVRPLEALGWDGDAREAAAFALLARQHLLGIPVDLEWATGAAGPRLLGKQVPA